MLSLDLVAVDVPSYGVDGISPVSPSRLKECWLPTGLFPLPVTVASGPRLTLLGLLFRPPSLAEVFLLFPVSLLQGSNHLRVVNIGLKLCVAEDRSWPHLRV